MREVQLRRMRQRKTVWVLGALVLLALGALWWWASQRPPSIVIPPRQYPPNNAYDAYKQIAQGVSDLFATDARLRDIESRLFSMGGAPVSQAERRYSPAEDAALSGSVPQAHEPTVRSSLRVRLELAVP
jgi:hypothetical protein